MLKYAYQCGVATAFQDSGLEKEAGWLKMKQALGLPLKEFEKWQLQKGLTSAAQVGRDTAYNKLVSRGRHRLATGLAST